ncbi:MAG: hypothetical protein ACYCQI_03925 [Gammaproteobacteria bacterium]
MHSQSLSHDRALEIKLDLPNPAFKTLSIKPPLPVLELASENQDQKASVVETEFDYIDMDDAEWSEFRSLLPERYRNISKAEADQLLREHKKQFIAEYIADFSADGSNAFFPVWLVKTGASGLILSAALLSGIAQATLAANTALNIASQVLAWTLAILATAQWIFMYSPWSEAVKNTLKRATQGLPSWSDIKKKLDALDHPGESTLQLLQFLALQFITKIVNFSAATTVVFFTPASFTWIPALLLLFLSARYCSQVWDESAKKGLEFWLNSKEHTSVIEQIKKGNYAIAFKTLFEGLGATALKALQFYFIAEGGQQLFGFWPSPVLTMICALLHGLLVNYPVAFKDTMGPLETLDRLLNAKLGKKIDEFIDAQITIISTLDEPQKAQHLKALVHQIKKDLFAVDLNTEEYKKVFSELDDKLLQLIKPLASLNLDNKTEKLALKNQIIKFNTDLLDAKIMNEGQRKLLMRDPLNKFTVILNTLFGGYAGYRLLSPMLSTVIAPAASIPIMTMAGAGLLGTFYSRAIIGTESKKVAAEFLDPDLHKNEVPDKNRKLVFTLAASGALSSGLAAIGSAGSIVKNSTAGVATVVYVATQKMINDTRYAEPFLAKTLKTHAKSIKNFYQKKIAPKFKKEVKVNSENKSIQIGHLRFWDVSPKTAAAIESAKSQLTDAVNFDRIRFWDKDKKPDPPNEEFFNRWKKDI